LWNTVKYFLPSAISLDSLIVAVAPKPPANHLRDGDGDDDDDEEEELKFKIPETTTWWKRKFFIFLRDKLRLPGNLALDYAPLFSDYMIALINVVCILLLQISC
jgi:hypothetical protein